MRPRTAAVGILACTLVVAMVDVPAEQYAVTRVLFKPITLRDCDRLGWRAIATVNQAWWERTKSGQVVQKWAATCIYEGDSKPGGRRGP